MTYIILVYGKVIPCYSWCCRAHTTAHKVLRTDHSTDSSVLHLEKVMQVGNPLHKYPELTAPQPQQFCVLKDRHGIRQNGKEAQNRLRKVSVCGQCHPYRPFVLTGAWASCLLARVLLQGRAVGGLHLCHSLHSDSRVVMAAGNQEDPSCLFWWLQEEGKSEFIKKGSLL